MKNLILLRGLPGNGKSTVAELFTNAVLIGSDTYHTDEHSVYNWKQENNKPAHDWCQQRAAHDMESGCDIVIHNTFTQEWEMLPYFELAERYGYRVHTLVVENRHGNTSVHNVPDAHVLAMARRFEIRL